jgi:hypothetical protein
MGVWVLMYAVVVPWGLYAIWKAARENWQDMEVVIDE